MKKYLVIYCAPASAAEAMQSATPEEMQAGMEQWHEWARNCGAALVDLGMPLGNGLTISNSGSAPSKRNVAGYSMVQAEDSAAALALLQGHPHLRWLDDCEIELHESMPPPG